MLSTNRPILLIEDDQVDAMTVRRALKELEVDNRLVHCEHGETALAYLENPDHDMPGLILLDLNMPVMDGVEFLEVVKSRPVLRRIPVVILTTSVEEQDKCRCFDVGIAGYIRKPVDYRLFVEIMRSAVAYWQLCEPAPL